LREGRKKCLVCKALVGRRFRDTEIDFEADLDSYLYTIGSQNPTWKIRKTTSPGRVNHNSCRITRNSQAFACAQWRSTVRSVIPKCAATSELVSPAKILARRSGLYRIFGLKALQRLVNKQYSWSALRIATSLKNANFHVHPSSKLPRSELTQNCPFLLLRITAIS
jgi:hypothetical protein